MNAQLVPGTESRLVCLRAVVEDPRIPPPSAELTEVEEETTGKGHLDGLASLDLTSLEVMLDLNALAPELKRADLDLFLGDLFLT